MIEADLWIKTMHILKLPLPYVIGTDVFHLYRAAPREAADTFGFSWVTTPGS